MSAPLDSMASRVVSVLAVWKQESTEWRQGDCVVMPLDFNWMIHEHAHLTANARAAAEQGFDQAAREYRGAVVLTQSCDVERNCDKRPFLEVAPLVEMEPHQIPLIRDGRMIQYLYIPALASQNLVGDLDLRMTVEKAVVADWDRVPGWATDKEGQKLTRAIVRKVGRFAVPTDIGNMLRRWGDEINEVFKRKGKPTAVGLLLNEVGEIRLLADKNWSTDPLKLEILLILRAENADLEKRIEAQIPTLRSMIGSNPRVADPVAISVETLSTMSAQRYLESDPMDFDHLSANSVTP